MNAKWRACPGSAAVEPRRSAFPFDYHAVRFAVLSSELPDISKVTAHWPFGGHGRRRPTGLWGCIRQIILEMLRHLIFKMTRARRMGEALYVIIRLITWRKIRAQKGNTRGARPVTMPAAIRIQMLWHDAVTRGDRTTSTLCSPSRTGHHTKGQSQSVLLLRGDRVFRP